MKYWFHIGGDNLGPLTHEDAETLVSDGKVTADTWAWFDGQGQWKPVREIPLLMETFPGLDRRSKDRRRELLEEGARLGLNLDIDPATTGLSGFGSRFIAGTIDLLFVCSALLGLLHMTGDLTNVLAGAYPVFGFPAWAFIPLAIYYITFASSIGGGRTLGYRAMNLTLVDQDTDSPASIQRAILWYLGLNLQAIGWIWYFIDPKKRMLHNIFSHTLVVSESAE